jgi:hypothetical protein
MNASPAMRSSGLLIVLRGIPVRYVRKCFAACAT